MKKVLIFTMIFIIAFSHGVYAATYIGNTNSWKFHHYGCKWERKMKECNRYYSKSRQELINIGMKPCNVCKP